MKWNSFFASAFVLCLTPYTSVIAQTAATTAQCRGGQVYEDFPGIYWKRNDGSIQKIYGQGHRLWAIASCGEGVVVAMRNNLHNGSVWIRYSPDCQNPHGGGSTERVYGGQAIVKDLIENPFGPGVLAVFNSNEIYYSPDCRNLRGGGSTIKISSE